MRRVDMSKVDWTIHGVIGEDLLSGMVDAHSHGLNKYGSRELQVVLNANAYIGLINIVGEMIRDGKVKLRGGMFLSGIFDDDALLRIDDARDCNGEPIWRLIIPDNENKFPEESYEEPYYLQIYSPYKDDINETVQGLFNNREKKFLRKLTAKAKHFYDHYDN